MSSSLAEDFIEKNKDFVLKLRLVGAGGTPQIRRVRLPRIAENGRITHASLVRVAIEYAHPGTQADPDEYEVVLTYYDVDNDCVTIATTEELVDAVEQFAAQENPVLRITTDVKKRQGERPRQNTAPAPAAAAATAGASAAPPASRTANLQNLVESFVSILAAAIVAIQQKMNYSTTQNAPRDPKEVAAAALENMEADQARELNQTAEQLVREVVGNIGMQAAAPDTANDTSTAPEQTTETQNPSAESVTEVEPQPEPEPVPFIHGRHTCDGCLTTPIIGVRYHAVNLPDYDLCSKCKENYKGNEIQFEPAELDRDRPFQERWHRKRAKWAHRANCPRPGGRPQGFGGRPHPCGRRNGPNHCHRRRGHQGRCGGPARPPTLPPQQPDMDVALKEAIRRSLMDVTVQPPVRSEPSTLSPSAPVEEPIEATVEVRPRAAPVFATVAVTATAAESVSGDTAEITEADSTASEEKNDEKPEAEEKEVVNVVDVKVTRAADEPPEVPVSIPVIPILAREVKTPTIPASVKEAAKVPVEQDIEEDAKVPAEEDIKIPAEEDAKVPAEEDVISIVPSVAPSVPPEMPSPSSTAFSDDADGNGSVAKVLGQTLDQCADAIDAMVSEIKRGKFSALSDSTDDSVTEVETKDDEKKEVANITTANFATSNTILSGDDDSDGWSVVEDKMSGESDVPRDDALARGTELVGSALFQSMSRSENDNTTLTNSVSSIPSSVPTLTSEIAAPVRDHWSAHLKKLRELGFGDEGKNVEILERLSAANIGVDSDDDVSITRVVNELLLD